MKRVIYRQEAAEQILDQGWQLIITGPDAYQHPSDIAPTHTAVTSVVPGTVAQALHQHRSFNPSKPHALNSDDYWYITTLPKEFIGNARLRFDGLATIADVYLNDDLILQSKSMFLASEVAVHLSGTDKLSICFRALEPYLSKPHKRARWRSAMMSNQGLRAIRTTTLGYMPGWCPDIQAVGPWRPITLISGQKPIAQDISVRAQLGEDGTGILHFEGSLSDDVRCATLCCAGEASILSRDTTGRAVALLHLPEIEPWWPNSHGKPKLHAVHLNLDGQIYPLGRTGFRSIAPLKPPHDEGFGLLVNGEPIFCRGAVWSSADLIGLSSTRETYEPFLHAAADAGMNMLRIAGTGTYEGSAFFELCDEFGILVWQDLMLANFDYPFSDNDFATLISEEINQLVARHQHSPSLAVLCGGSEMQQQASMFGLNKDRHATPEFDDLLNAVKQNVEPNIIVVPNSPMGGSLPFFPSSGVAHYFGVGGYRQPLSDIRRSNISFASECLALSNIPEQQTLSQWNINDPAWSDLVPKDRGADWNFEDIRDHYLQILYGINPRELRNNDPECYLAFSKATSAELLTELFSEFRRSKSPCNGALLLMLQDLHPSCGWGLLDNNAFPKSPYFAARRIFQPIGLSLTDEATNGLDIHLWNETQGTVTGMLELICIKDGKPEVLKAKKDVHLPPRSIQSFNACDIIGSFFDVNYAYRFGPASHEITSVRLVEIDNNRTIMSAFHFPLGRSQALFDAGLKVESISDTKISIIADRFAQSVKIECSDWIPSDNYFHLSAGEVREINFRPTDQSLTKATGIVTHLGTKKLNPF